MLLVFYPSSTVGMIIKLIAAFLLAAGVSTLLFAYNSSGRVWKNIPAMVIVNVVVYSSKGEVVASGASANEIIVETASFVPGVYFYMAADEAGYKKTGKLLVK